MREKFGNSTTSQRQSLWKVKLWLFAARWMKNIFVGTDYPGASLIVDCCLGIEEVLKDGQANKTRH